MVYIYQITDSKGRSHIGAAKQLDGLWETILYAATHGKDDSVSLALRRQNYAGFTLRLLEEVEEQFLPQRIGYYQRMFPETIVEYADDTVKGEEYIVTSPSGERMVIFNLNRFCREHGLSKGTFNLVLQGKRKQHHGWKVERVKSNDTK